MKIRTSFVSNSSSSSFIIGCNKIPQNIDEMQELLGFKELEISPGEIISSGEVATKVFNDITIINNLEKDDYYDDIVNYNSNMLPINNKISKDLLDKQIKEISDLFEIDEKEFSKLVKNTSHFSYLHYFYTIVKPDIKKNVDKCRYSDKKLSFRTEYPEMYKKKINIIQSKYTSLYDKESLKLLLDQKSFFTVEYSDDTEYTSAFENGGVFENTSHSICSMH